MRRSSIFWSSLKIVGSCLLTDALCWVAFYSTHFTPRGGKGRKNSEVKNKARQSKLEKKGAFKASLGGALAKRFAPAMPPLPGSSPGKPQTPQTTKSNIQIRRHPIKNTPEAVILGAAISANAQEGYFNVPLIDYLRTVTRLGHRDKEVPIGTLFGILERMRAMARDVSYINSLCTMSDENGKRRQTVIACKASSNST